MSNTPKALPVAPDPTVNVAIETIAGVFHMHPCLDTLLAKFVSRAEFGYKKYGQTTDANPLKYSEWLNHMQEELMDAIVYGQRLLKEKDDAILRDHILSLAEMALYVTYTKENIPDGLS